MRRGIRVALVTDGSLLGATTLRLLGGVAGLDVVRVQWDDPGMEEAITQATPTAIVLDAGDMSYSDGVVIRLLNLCPRTRVIVLNLGRTGMEVYRMRRVTQADPQELLGVILGKGDMLNLSYPTEKT